MAVTAHYILETPSSVQLRSRLIAFRYVPGSHDGLTIGAVFIEILDEFQVLDKIGQITSDNASNNTSAMICMENVLDNRGIIFSRLANHSRYVLFPPHYPILIHC